MPLDDGDRASGDDIGALRLLGRIAVLANESDSFTDAVMATLASVCAYTRWPLGHAYFFGSDDAEELASTSYWHGEEGTFEEFRRITESTPLLIGIGLPGRVARSKSPEWIHDVRVDANFPRAHMGTDIEVVGAFGFPILAGRDVVAVLEFFSDKPEPRNDRLLELMGHVGTQLGRVAERERAAARLIAQVQQTTHLIESAYEAFVSIDTSGAIIGWNAAAEATFGWPRGEALRRPLADMIIPERYRSAHLGGIERYLETGEGPVLNTRLELAAIHRDGHEFPIELAIWPVEIDGKQTFCAFVHDITERKRADQVLREAYGREREMVDRLRELDRAKSRFVSSVSHELRTPLTSIIGYLDLFRRADSTLDDSQNTMLDVISRNSQRLLSLIEDLLTQSSIESGTFRLHFAPTRVSEVIDAAVRSVLPTATSRGLKVEVDVAGDIGVIDADGEQLERLILNLLTNAIKFTSEGVVRVTGRRERDVVISVVDTGVGIPAADLRSLFKPFFRSSHSDRQAVPGTGLGLVIAKAISDLHGGTIDVQSREGSGTTITISLPVRQIPDES